MHYVMYCFLHCLVSFTRGVLVFLQLDVCLSAALSCLPADKNSVYLRLAGKLSEPFRVPARLLCSKVGFLAAFPIDMSYIITEALLFLIGVLLPEIVL